MLRKIWNKIKSLPRWIKIVGVLAVIIFLGFRLFSGGRQSSEPEFQKVERGRIEETISTSGVLTGQKQVSLNFATSGRLTYLGFEEGDYVQKGQVVARVDGTLASVTLQQAMNTLRDREATLLQIYDEVKGHSADESFEQKSERTTAEVAKDNAFDAVRASRRTLQDSTLIAPVSGFVTLQDDIAIGENVGPTVLIAQIVDLSEKIFEADVDESDIGKISLDQKAKVTLNTYGDKVFEGRIVELSPVTKTTTSGATVVSVKIALADTNIQNIDGLNGQGRILLKEKDGVLVIPQRAILGENEVYVRIAGGTERRTIQTGLTSDENIEVVGGLIEGDEIVVNPEVIPVQ